MTKDMPGTPPRPLQVIFLVSILCCLPVALRAQSVFVPLNHWSYAFVERMEAKGLVHGALNSTKPFSREEMVRYLVQVEKNGRAQGRLNAVESRQLDFLHFEFREEFLQLTGSDGHAYETRIEKLRKGRLFPHFLYKNNRNMFNLQKDDFKVFIDPILSQKVVTAEADSLSSTERVYERSHGLTMWGQLGNTIGFFFDFRDTKEWGTRTYPDKFDISLPGLGFVNGYGTHIWHDETIAYVVFKLPHLQLTIGKGNNYWGPGFNGALGLSNNATSYDQIRLQSRFWRLKFTYLWGFLRTFPVIEGSDGRAAEKNIVGHRLEIDVAKWLDLGFYETVIFGNRRFELAYANPINFYRSAEHFLGDNDNAAMGMDFDLLLIPNTKIYGELFIDDLFTSRIGSGWFGNKVAYLAGAYWVDALSVPNLDARVEYARTRPFVYTHEKAINTYSHFSTGLGHWIGPNADDLLMRLQYRFSKSLAVALDFESYRHGANPLDRNVGGDINQPFRPGDPAFVHTLDGIHERRNRFGVEVSYELYRNFFLNLNFNSASSKNMLLPGGVRGPVDRTEFGLTLALNK